MVLITWKGNAPVSHVADTTVWLGSVLVMAERDRCDAATWRRVMDAACACWARTRPFACLPGCTVQPSIGTLHRRRPRNPRRSAGRGSGTGVQDTNAGPRGSRAEIALYAPGRAERPRLLLARPSSPNSGPTRSASRICYAAAGAGRSFRADLSADCLASAFMSNRRRAADDRAPIGAADDAPPNSSSLRTCTAPTSDSHNKH